MEKTGSKWFNYVPIFIGNPAGNCNVMKSLNFAKCELLFA